MMLRRPLVLSGPPASGKTTLGRAIAAAVGCPFIDLDLVVEDGAGQSIAGLFAREGEAGFRTRERAAFLRALAQSPPAVIATGGGTLGESGLRRHALRVAHVVGVDAPAAVLLARAAQAPGARPLLAGDLEAQLATLLQTRADVYAEVHATVSAVGAPDDVVARLRTIIDELERCETLVVPLGKRSYRVFMEPLARARVRAEACRPSALFAVSDESVIAALPDVAALLAEIGHVLLSGRGDVDKHQASLAQVWDAALAQGIDRNAMILGIGGGVVTDLAGFAAATLLRGIRAGHAPTTLLAMVDASVGGKTGIDHQAGKNLIGAFHQPSFVVCDTQTLRTLPPRELCSGLAEVAKVALVGDPVLVGRLADRAARLSSVDVEAIVEAIAEVVPAAIQAKIDVVVEDEREEGVRMLLNFGHTIGHALEMGSGYLATHGACVAVGMNAAIDLGERLGVTPTPVAKAARALLRSLGLPSSVSALGVHVDAAAAQRALLQDKKRRDGSIRFVFLQEVGAAGVHSVSKDEAGAALVRVFADIQRGGM